ncbi:UAP56-interacting factor [Acipenser ruthenus]|uniref:UAP56-interacting factor n=1 Tax=Acipenser ruthenus TaxID=7906 RepID=A0A444U6R8_ACIRT|nr:UAP56-interacting factor [Acipenser ruthenus]
MTWKPQQGWRAPPILRTAWHGTQQQQQRGLGINRLGVRGKKLLPAVGKRRAQGIGTWLAARKPGALQKGISPLNRPTFTQMLEDLEEKKVPKGVSLEFDINSVGKQTALTLNERFKILKDQRTAVAQTKGSRFVTVG